MILTFTHRQLWNCMREDGDTYTCWVLGDLLQMRGCTQDEIEDSSESIAKTAQNLFLLVGIVGVVQEIGGYPQLQLPGRNKTEFMSMRVKLREHLDRTPDDTFTIELQGPKV